MIPKIGDHLIADGWYLGENLLPSDGYKDSSFPGCQFRVQLHKYKVAINLEITGKVNRRIPKNGAWGRRCRIEIVGDGEPSKFTRGWIISNP